MSGFAKSLAEYDAYLGALFHGAPVDKEITPAMFFDQGSRTIFTTLRKQILEGIKPSGITVMEELREQKLLDAAGGAGNVTRIASNLSLPEKAASFAETIKRSYKDSVLHGDVREALAAAIGDLDADKDSSDWLPKLKTALEKTEAVSEASTLGAKITCFSDIMTEVLEWLWPGRVPLGKFTLFAGNPGCGKSTASDDIGAHVSTGRDWPDGSKCPLGDVIMLTSEDDPADTIKPRLQAAGADMRRVHVLGGAVTVQNTAVIKNAIEQVRKKGGDVKLLIIDPLDSYLGGADSYKNAEVREALDGLKNLAADEGFAIIAIQHLNKKAGGSANYRIGGSIAFTALARAAWVFAKDERNPGANRRLFLPLKNNLGKDFEGLEYTIESRLIVAETAKGMKTIETSLIVWGAAASDSLDDVLSTPRENAKSEEFSPEQEAILDLMQENGKAMRTSEIAKELSKKSSATSNLLYRLLDRGKVSKGAVYGTWVLTPPPLGEMNSVSGVSSVSDTEKREDLHDIHHLHAYTTLGDGVKVTTEGAA